MTHHAEQDDPTLQPQLVEWEPGKVALTGLGPVSIPWMLTHPAFDSVDAIGAAWAYLECPNGGVTNQYIYSLGGGTTGWRWRVDSAHAPTMTYVNNQVGGSGYVYVNDSAQRGTRRLVELWRDGADVWMDVYDPSGALVAQGYNASLTYNPAGSLHGWLFSHVSNKTRFEGKLRAFRLYDGPGLTAAERATVRADMLADTVSPVGVLRNVVGETPDDQDFPFDAVNLAAGPWYVKSWTNLWSATFPAAWDNYEGGGGAEYRLMLADGTAAPFKIILNDDGTLGWETYA